MTFLNNYSDGASREESGSRSFVWDLFNLPTAHLCFGILALTLMLPVKIQKRKETALSWARWDFSV